MCRPKILMTMGDVAGIGPEVVLRACQEPEVRAWCLPTVVGDAEILRRAAHLIGSAVRIVETGDVDDRCDEEGALACWNPSDVTGLTSVKPGETDGRAGRAAYDYVLAAARAARDGRVDGIVTAPLNKASLHKAGVEHPGHTEILAAVCEVADFAMMLYLPPDGKRLPPTGLGVAHATLHTSLASVPKLLSAERIVRKIQLVSRFMSSIGCRNPRVGVCALNPHGGEEGLFGDEEARLIGPAVAEASRSGVNAVGPLPADTLFRRAVEGAFDGVVAMYHDQGHIALKLVDSERATNITLGLPLIRTSPSHGTAFDIAWSGRANPAGMIEAIRLASQLARHRREASLPTP